MGVLEKSGERFFPNFYIMACFKQEANYNRTCKREDRRE